MNVHISVPLLIAVAALFPSLALADNRTINETAIMQAAMQASPDFLTISKDEAESKADAGQAARLENPTVDFGVARTSARGGDSNSYDIDIEQPLKLSHLTGARLSLSSALFEQTELRRRYAMLQAYWQTKQLYAQAWQYQQQVKLYADFQKRAQDAAASMNKSVKAGQTPVSEGSLFAGDAAKFSGDLERIEAQKAQVILQLEKATGLNLNGVELEKPFLTAVTEDVASYEAQAQNSASLVRLLQADLKAAERLRQAALTDSAIPEIAPRVMYGRSTDNKEDTLGIGVVLTIPLWDRNQAERQKANAQRIYARRKLDTLQSIPLSERLRRTLDSINRLDRRIRLLEDEALPNYRKAFSQAQRSFNAGQTDAAVLWQIRERLLDTEREFLEATLEAIEARRVLSLETGTMPQEAL